MTDWAAVLGCDPDEYASRIYASRPGWIAGHIAYEDAKFLFGRALRSGASTAVEIGTASGLSTAVLCRALDAAHRAGAIGPRFSVDTYDIDAMFFADRAHRTGDAAREMLSPELLEHVSFRAPATARDVSRHHAPGSIAFAFVDATHQHPWPTLDLLTLLPTLAPGAEVVLHDINLPLVKPEGAQWGAKHLFDALDVEKHVDEASEPPNIGAIRIPADKAALRAELLAVLHSHRWEADADQEAVRAASA